MEEENRSVREPVPTPCHAVVEGAASTWDQARKRESVLHANAVINAPFNNLQNSTSDCLCSLPSMRAHKYDLFYSIFVFDGWMNDRNNGPIKEQKSRLDLDLQSSLVT